MTGKLHRRGVRRSALDEIAIPVRGNFAIQAIDNRARILDLDAYPVSMSMLADSVSGATPSEWVQYPIAWNRTQLDDALEQLCAKGVRRPLIGFELPMPDRRNVGPYVFKINAVRIHGV